SNQRWLASNYSGSKRCATFVTANADDRPRATKAQQEPCRLHLATAPEVRAGRNQLGETFPSRWARRAPWASRSAKPMSPCADQPSRVTSAGKEMGSLKATSIVQGLAKAPEPMEAAHRASVHMPWAIARLKPNIRARTSAMWMGLKSPDTRA